MKVKTYVLFALIFLITIVTLIFLFNSMNVPQRLGRSNTFATISANHQRKLFFANGFHWIFFCNGSQLLYSYSSNGVSWNKPVVFENGSSSSAISIWFDQKVHYVYAPGVPSGSVLYRQGEIVGKDIVWEEYRTVIKGLKGPVFFLTNRATNNGTWIMDSSGLLQKDVSTMISLGNGSNQCFLFQSGQEIMSSIGEELPTKCTRKGWISAERVKETQRFDGLWKIQANLINDEETNHSGRLSVRLWKFHDENASDATPLTDWVEGNKIYFSNRHEEKTAKIDIPMANVTFTNEFLFIEFGWKVEHSTSRLARIKLECSNLSKIETPSYRHYNGYCIKDSRGYPWAACIGSDGASWYAYAAKAGGINGSDWEQPQTIFGPFVTTRRVSILPLEDGKVYAVCAGTDGVMGRIWNGTSWKDEEVITSTSLVVNFGYSAVGHGDEVHLVLLEKTSRDILYLLRTDETRWQEEIVEEDLDHRSLPVICVDESNDNLYCFWIYDDVIWMKKKVNGIWKNLSHPFGEDFGKVMGISCFYKVFDGVVGVAWLEQHNNFYEPNYRFLLTEIWRR